MTNRSELQGWAESYESMLKKLEAGPECFSMPEGTMIGFMPPASTPSERLKNGFLMEDAFCTCSEPSDPVS